MTDSALARFPKIWVGIGVAAMLGSAAVIFGLEAAVTQQESAPSSVAQPQTADGPTIHVLPNGLTVIVVEDHIQPTIHATLVVKAGSIHDPEGMAGTAHLLQHLVLQGTDQLGTLNWSTEKRYLDAVMGTGTQAPFIHQRVLGAQVSETTLEPVAHLQVDRESTLLLHELGARHITAATGLEHTEYRATLPSNLLGQWLRLQAEALRPPALRRFAQELATLKTEIGTITPHALVPDPKRAPLFAGHRYQRPTQGTAASLARINRADLERLWEAQYTANNSAVVLVGDVDPESAVAMVTEHFGQLERRGAMPESLGRPPPMQGISHVPASSRRSVAMHWPIVGATAHDWRVLELVGAWLESALTDTHTPLRGVRTRLRRHKHGGTFSLAGTCKRPEQTKQCVTELQDAVADLLSTAKPIPATGSVLKRANEHAMRQVASPHAHTTLLIEQFVTGATNPQTREGDASTDPISGNDLRNTARKHLFGAYAIEHSGSGRLERFEPRPLRIKTEPIPPNKRSTLANAVLDMPRVELEHPWAVRGEHYTSTSDGRVLAVKNPYNPLFDLSLIYHRGWLDDPLLCQAVNRWEAASRVPEDGGWARPLQADGVSVSVECDADRTSIHLSGPSDVAARAVDEVRDQLRVAFLSPKRRAPTRLPWRQLRTLPLLYGPSVVDDPPTRAKLRLATDADAYASLSKLQDVTPDMLWLGPGTADSVAALYPGERHPPRAQPQPHLTSRPRFIIKRPSKRPSKQSNTVRIWFSRWGEAYDPQHEGMYAVLDSYLGRTAGGLGDRAREHVHDDVQLSSTYHLGNRGERNRLSGALTTPRSAMPGTVEFLLNALTTRQLTEETVDALVSHAETRQTEHVDRSDLRWHLYRAELRGLQTDPRELVTEQLKALDHGAFNALMASEAASAPVFIVYADLDYEEMVWLQRLGDLEWVE